MQFKLTNHIQSCGYVCARARVLAFVLLVPNISCGYTGLLPEVTQWVIALGWDRFGFLVRFSPPVTL